MGPVAVCTSTVCSVMIILANLVWGWGQGARRGDDDLMRLGGPLLSPSTRSCSGPVTQDEPPVQWQPATQVGPSHLAPFGEGTPRTSSSPTPSLDTRRIHPGRTRGHGLPPHCTGLPLSAPATLDGRIRPRPLAPARTAPGGLPSAPGSTRDSAIRLCPTEPLRLPSSAAAAAARTLGLPSRTALPARARPPPVPSPSHAACPDRLAVPWHGSKPRSTTDDRRRLHPLVDLLGPAPRHRLLLLLLGSPPPRPAPATATAAPVPALAAPPALHAAGLPRTQESSAPAPAPDRLVRPARVRLHRVAQGRARARGGPALDLCAGQGAQEVGWELEAQGRVRCLAAVSPALCLSRLERGALTRVVRTPSRAVIEGTGIALDTPEAVARWIEERKKRWPSKKVVDEKVRRTSSLRAAHTDARANDPPGRRSAPVRNASPQGSRRLPAARAGAGAGGAAPA